MLLPVNDANYRHRLVVPDFPAPEAYFPLLRDMHASGWYSNFGPLVRRLEAGLSSSFGAPSERCVACGSATAGLSAALIASARAGRVLLPAFTFPASLGAVRAAGLSPVVADVDPYSWALDGKRLDRTLAATKASVVMLVTPFGIQRDWDDELAICRAHGAAVVIDSASGLGVPRPRHDRGEGVFEVFSLHATKVFAIGEGGMIFAHHAHEEDLRSALNFALRSHAEPRGPHWGFNGKMSELHAAVGIAQLRRIHELVARRQAFVKIYHERLAQFPELVFPQDLNRAPWQFCPVLLPTRTAAESFIAGAAAGGVEIRRYYRPSLSHWPETPRLGPCPVSEDLAERMCVLPVRALDLNSDENHGCLIDLIIEALHGHWTAINVGSLCQRRVNFAAFGHECANSGSRDAVLCVRATQVCGDQFRRRQIRIAHFDVALFRPPLIAAQHCRRSRGSPEIAYDVVTKVQQVMLNELI